jgi:hypothetical protein
LKKGRCAVGGPEAEIASLWSFAAEKRVSYRSFPC